MTSPPSRIARVAVPVPLHRLFDYSVPESMPQPVIGARVAVPFAGRRLVGVVTALNPEDAHDKVRPLSKVLDEESRLLERVGGGFGMVLKVFERERALHMVSQAYFLEWRGRRLYLPTLLTPGTAHVIHSDEGGGRFRFRLTIAHPLLGCLFSQDGRFADDTKAPRPAKGWMT